MGEHLQRLKVFGGIEKVPFISHYSNAACEPQPLEGCRNMWGQLKFLARGPAELGWLAHVSVCSLCRSPRLASAGMIRTPPCCIGSLSCRRLAPA